MSHSAKEVCKFIECLTLSGDYAGQKFKLRPWQRAIIEKIFDTKTKDGHRQYTDCGIWLPRKNAKTELSAALAAYFLFCDTTQGEIYSAAGEREQAGIVFGKLKGMILNNPHLRKSCKIVSASKRVINERTGSVFVSLSSEDGTKHGYNPSFVIADEVHVWKRRELYTALTTGSEARLEKLILTTTTAGVYNPESLEWELYDYAVKVRDGIVDDPTYLPVIYEAAKEDDWLDEKVWHKANPALGDFRSLESMRRQAKRAKENPRLENDFRRRFLNQHTQQTTRWLPMDKWNTAYEMDCDPLEFIPDGETVFGGLDLAATTDIAAFCLACKHGDSYRLQWRFWIPEERMRDIENTDRVPYSAWVRGGFVKATPGPTIDYGVIVQDILEDSERYNLRFIGYDPWNATATSQALEAEGLSMVKVRQGAGTLSEPCRELERCVTAETLQHGHNQVANWMANNVEVHTDFNGNIRPVRPKHNASSSKIDGMVAAIMAIKLASTQDTPEEEGTSFENLEALWND